MSYVELVDLSKSYGDTLALARTSLSVREGELFALLGPSGCGKTTTLRIVAGFVRPDSGDVLIAGNNVTAMPPERRGIGIVFQNYAIFPHMHVYDNIAFGLRMRKLAAGDIQRRVKAALEQVDLIGYEARYQRELSGGEQQRVALARVLVTEPSILLLDEPLSALDKKLREEMKYWIKELQQKLGITTIYVTHDQGEALTMSDRIAVMNKGEVIQIGTPRDIYEHPVNRFVTTFIGDSTILNARVVAVNGATCRIAIGSFEAVAPHRDGVSVGDEVALVLRPESVLLDAEAENADANVLRGTVQDHSYQGSIIRYRLDLAGQTLIAEAANRSDREVLDDNAEVAIGWRPEDTEILHD